MPRAYVKGLINLTLSTFALYSTFTLVGVWFSTPYMFFFAMKREAFITQGKSYNPEQSTTQQQWELRNAKPPNAAFAVPTERARV